MPVQAPTHRHGPAFFRHSLWRFYKRRTAGAAADAGPSPPPQVHRTPSQGPIRPYEAGEGLLRPLPPSTTPFGTAAGQLVDTEEPLRVSDRCLCAHQASSGVENRSSAAFIAAYVVDKLR